MTKDELEIIDNTLKEAAAGYDAATNHAAQNKHEIIELASAHARLALKTVRLDLFRRLIEAGVSVELIGGAG